MTNFFLILLNLLLICSYSKAEFYSEHYGEIEVSSTIFLEDIEGDNRKNFLNSTKVEYNYFFEKDNLTGKLKMNIKDSYPGSAQNLDFNEAYLDYAFENTNILAGNNIVFWGKNEFYNPVDIINSKDYSLGLASGKKIGQTMFNIKRYFSSSELDFYILPSNTNIYPKSQVRSQQTLNIKSKNNYSKGAKKENLGIGLRWSGYIDEYDYGLTFYKGNTKDPALIVSSNQLVPNYSEITQIGIELQATQGDFLHKGEFINRSNQYNLDGNIDDYYGFIVGTEHTLYGLFEKNWDLSNIIEYTYDSRGSKSHHSNQNDLFYGARLILNDIDDTQYFISLQNDIDKNTRAMTFNYESRFFSQFKGGIDMYVPINLEDDYHQSSFKDEVNFKIYTSYAF